MILRNKLSFLILFCLSLSFYSHSQSLTFHWKKTFGGEKNNTIKAVSEDDDGNIVFAGESQNENNKLDLWLLKIDKEGKTIWTRTFPKKGHQRAFSIKKTETGFMVGGNDIVSSIEARPFILYIDNDGNPIKKTPIKYSQNLRLNQIKQVGNDFYAVGTTIKYTDDLYTDGILIKFNKDFDVSWEMKFQPDTLIFKHPATGLPWYYVSTIEPRDFLIMNDETLVLTGYQSSKKVTDFWTTNVDIKNQKVRWNHRINEYNGGDEAFQLLETHDNQVLMIGTRYDKIPPNYSYRGQVVKYDKTTGKVLFAKNYETEKTSYFDRILKAFPTKNGYFLIGLSGKNPSRVGTAIVPQDIWLVFIDHAGKMLWEETIPQVGEEHGINFLVTAKNEYYVFAKAYQENGTSDLQVLKIAVP